MATITIAYAGRNGMTRECAERLAKELNGIDVTVCNLADRFPDLAKTDVLLAGSAVRHGRLLPEAKRFFDEVARTGGDLPVGVFLCCGYADRFMEYRDRLIPRDLLERAFLTSNFGGTLNPAGKPFWDRMWLFFARSGIVESEIEDGEYTPVLPGMIPENIGQMASFARRQLAGKRIAEMNNNAQ